MTSSSFCILAASSPTSSVSVSGSYPNLRFAEAREVI